MALFDEEEKWRKKRDAIRKYYEEHKDTYERFQIKELRNLRLRLNLTNFETYALLFQTHTGISSLSSAYDRKILWQIAKGKYRSISMSYRLIHHFAEILGIPSELLVDEELYYRRSGYAGYRVVLEMCRQGMDIAELIEHEQVSKVPSLQKSWRRVWAHFIKGTPDALLIGSSITRLILQCIYRKLGLKMVDLIARPLAFLGAPQPFSSLASNIVQLGTYEYVFLMSMAQALWGKKFYNTDLDKDMEALLKWYKERVDSEKGKPTCHELENRSTVT